MELENPRQLMFSNCEYANNSTQDIFDLHDDEITPRNISFLASLRSIKGQDNINLSQGYFKLNCDEHSSKSPECPFAMMTNGKACSEIVNGANKTAAKDAPGILEQACQEDFLNCIPEITESPSKRYLTMGTRTQRTCGMLQGSNFVSSTPTTRLRHGSLPKQFLNFPNTGRDCGGIPGSNSTSHQNMYSSYYSRNYNDCSPVSYMSEMPGNYNKVGPDSFTAGGSCKHASEGMSSKRYCHKDGYPYRHEVELTVKPDNTWHPGHQHNDVVSTVKVRVDIMQTCNPKTSPVAMSDVQFNPKEADQNICRMWSEKSCSLLDDKTVVKHEYDLESGMKGLSSPLQHQTNYSLKMSKMSNEIQHQNLVCKPEKLSHIETKSRDNGHSEEKLKCTLKDNVFADLKYDIATQQKSLEGQNNPTEPEAYPNNDNVKQEPKPKKTRNNAKTFSKQTSKSTKETRKTFTGNKLVPILPRQPVDRVFMNRQLMSMGKPNRIHDENKQNIKETIHMKRRVPPNTVLYNEMAGACKKPYVFQPDQGKYPVQYTPNNSTQTQVFPAHMTHQSNRLSQPGAPPSPIQNLSDLVAKLIPDINTMTEIPANNMNACNNNPCFIPTEFIGKLYWLFMTYHFLY